jgi:hypothetical protein
MMSESFSLYDGDPASRRRARPRRQANVTARQAAQAPGRFAAVVTQRKGTYTGRGALTGILLIGYTIVLIRIVADYEVQEDGTARGNILHPQGQLGPLPIAVSLTTSFFLLSLLAVGGGTRAKLAVILGASIVIVLAMKSMDEINTVASTFGNISKITVPAASGAEGSGAASTSPASGSSGSSGTSPGSSSGSSAWTPTLNSLSAAQRAFSNLVSNFGTDFIESFNISNPSELLHATEQQWNDLTNSLADIANASDDAAAAAAKQWLGNFAGGISSAWSWVRSLF